MRWVVALAFLATAPLMRANTVVWGYTGDVTSGAGSTGPADVLVRFGLLDNVIEIAIWNNEADVKSDISTLNSIDFVLSGLQTAGTITGRSGMELNFPSSGTNVVPDILDGGTAAFTNDTNPDWQLISSPYLTSGLELSAIRGNHDHTIVGPSGPGGIFSNINPSMPKHNPYLYTPGFSAPVQFTLSVPGVRSTDTIEQVRFWFGTDFSAGYDGHFVTPEPGTWFLVGTGLLGVLAWRRKRSKARS